VTIRLLDGKEEVYDDFKAVVTQELHSDVCYVVTMLMETFNQAVAQKPKAEPIVMEFVKQNVQINMGCTFQYYTKKARRTPQDLIGVTTDKHTFLPPLLNQFPTLSKEAQEYWIKELQAQGYILTPPTAKPKSTFTQKLKDIWRIVKHLFAG
jgi:hypothetical protein